jgi:GntR family transcriptional regulator/MocR family aminotransferase
MIVIEDDYDYDFHYEGRPILPLAATDRAGVVVYLGTMSKVLAPGLRLGYVVAPTAVIRRIAAYRTVVDGQGDHALEHAIACLLEDGEVQRHAQRACQTYRIRRDALCAALARALPQLDFTPPSGGMALWVRAPGVDVDAWVRRGLEAGVAFQPEQRFRADDQPGDHVRLGFAACTPAELDEAVARMAAALPGDRRAGR